MRFRYLVWLGSVLSISCGGQNAAGAEQPATGHENQADRATEPSESTLPPGVTRCQDLMTRLCADLGPTTATCELVRARTAEIDESDCSAMSRHYPQVLAELAEYETRNQPLSPAEFAQMTDGVTTTHGPANAAVTIVIFSDFQCPFCAGAAAATHDVLERYGDRVRVVFRQFPLPFHHNAHAAAEAALAANAQGKFWPMHDILFANQGELDRASLTRYAHSIGLNVGTFDAALDNETYAAAVDADLELGVELGVNATPTMFMNGAKVPNASDVDAVTARIDGILNSSTPTPAAQ